MLEGMDTMPNLPSADQSWHEPCGDGIHRAHRRTCPASHDLKPGRRCDCPYTYWQPRDGMQQRRRARVHGALADAQRAKRQAHAAARARRRERSNQRAGVTPMPTLNGFFDYLLQGPWSCHRVSTRERRQQDYDTRLRDPLGTERLDRLTDKRIAAWLHERIAVEGNRRCVQAAHDTLICMLAVAVTERLLHRNEAKAVPYPVEGLKHNPVHVLDLPQYRQLMTGCRARDERLVLRLLCDVGMRGGELVALRRDDLDLARRLITIERRHYRMRCGTIDVDSPKSRKPRTVAISQTLAEELRWHLADTAETNPTPYVFTRCNIYTNHQPAPLTHSSLVKLVHGIAKRAGMVGDNGRQWVRPHVCRRSGASIYVASGGDPNIARMVLGHSRLETTLRYLKLPPDPSVQRPFGEVFEQGIDDTRDDDDASGAVPVPAA